MSGLDADKLDRWITDGRFREEALVCVCPNCEEPTFVKATTEYGMTTWDPAECSTCKRTFTGGDGERWDDDEPPEPEERDDFEEYGRFEPWV